MRIKSLLPTVFMLLAFATLSARPRITELSDFRLQGEFELRNSPGFEPGSLAFATLNHEGGLKIRVLEIGPASSRSGIAGRWFRVILNSGVFVDSLEFVESGSRFWIFIPDNEEIFEFEE